MSLQITRPKSLLIVIAKVAGAICGSLYLLACATMPILAGLGLAELFARHCS